MLPDGFCEIEYDTLFVDIHILGDCVRRIFYRYFLHGADIQDLRVAVVINAPDSNTTNVLAKGNLAKGRTIAPDDKRGNCRRRAWVKIASRPHYGVRHYADDIHS